MRLRLVGGSLKSVYSLKICHLFILSFNGGVAAIFAVALMVQHFLAMAPRNELSLNKSKQKKHTKRNETFSKCFWIDKISILWVCQRRRWWWWWRNCFSADITYFIANATNKESAEKCRTQFEKKKNVQCHDHHRLCYPIIDEREARSENAKCNMLVACLCP